MWIIITLLILLVILALLFVLLCRFIGQKFLRNLRRRDPGETFKADIDVSFYQNSPHKLAAEEGLALMATLPHEDICIRNKLIIGFFILILHRRKPILCIQLIHNIFQSHKR